MPKLSVWRCAQRSAVKVMNRRVRERPSGVSLPALAQVRANLKAPSALFNLVVDVPMAKDPLCLSGPAPQLSHSRAAVISFYQTGISHVTTVHFRKETGSFSVAEDGNQVPL